MVKSVGLIRFYLENKELTLLKALVKRNLGVCHYVKYKCLNMNY